MNPTYLVLLDAVNNPNLSIEITKYIHEKFGLYTSDVRIRPLGHTIEAHIGIKLEPELTLKDTLQITKDLQVSIADKFNIKEVSLVPVLPSQ